MNLCINEYILKLRVSYLRGRIDQNALFINNYGKVEFKH